MASAAATEATLYDVDMPQHQHQLDPRHDNSAELVDDKLLDAADGAGANPSEEDDEGTARQLMLVAIRGPFLL
jgi:hypothetical protein